LPGLRECVEDVEPNLDYELEQFTRKFGTVITFSREARSRFLKFAASAEALWNGNFRDLNGAVTRMATLATGGRISVDGVTEEMERLCDAWREPQADRSGEALLQKFLDDDVLADINLFDRMQLGGVLKVCSESPSLSEAGRHLFSASRERKATSNDADRLRKYLARFGLDWKPIQGKS
jgi:transcriptional regulatory protein RtcR